jgi:hypothetical protein
MLYKWIKAERKKEVADAKLIPRKNRTHTTELNSTHQNFNLSEVDWY